MGEWDICVRSGRMRQDFPARGRQEGTPGGGRGHREVPVRKNQGARSNTTKAQGWGYEEGSGASLGKASCGYVKKLAFDSPAAGVDMGETWTFYQCGDRSWEADTLMISRSAVQGVAGRYRSPPSWLRALLFFTFSSLKTSLHFYSKGPFLLQVNSCE